MATPDASWWQPASQRAWRREEIDPHLQAILDEEAQERGRALPLPAEPEAENIWSDGLHGDFER